MLLAVTPNPTIDRTLDLPALEAGTVHRARAVHLAAGGKGLNVVRVAQTLGLEGLATAPLAGHSGRLVAELAANEGLPAGWFWLTSGETRSTLLLNHENGDATVINEPGPTLSEADWQGFAAHVRQLAAHSEAVLFSGSLPLGVAGEAYATLTRNLTGQHAVYVDTSRAALQAVLAQPDRLCLKVNQAELAAGLEQPLPDLPAVVKAGQSLLARGAALVVITLGADGALAIAPEGCWLARNPSVDIVSTVGSGDAFLTGLAIGRLRGENIEVALALAVACGTANTLTALPGRLECATVEWLQEQVTCERLA